MIFRPCDVDGLVPELNFLNVSIRALRQLDRIVTAPKLDRVEDKGVKQCRKHIHRHDDHAEEDDLLHPFIIHFAAALDPAVPTVDVPRQVERSIASRACRREVRAVGHVGGLASVLAHGRVGQPEVSRVPGAYLRHAGRGRVT